jgi:hypothetical protein
VKTKLHAEDKKAQCKILRQCKLFHLDNRAFQRQPVAGIRPPALPLQLQEVVMRYFGLVLASLLLIGCGTPGSSKSDPLREFVSSPPSIAELTPGSVPVNSVPFTMTINGSNFLPDAVVFWQGTPQSTLFVTPNQLMVKLTDTDLMFMGMVPVYVRTGGQNSNTVDFEVTAQ